MALPGGHIEPLMEIRLFDPGQGDPVVTDHGFSFFDSLFDSNKIGRSSRDAKNIELLEWLDGIGLTNRGFFLPQDTFLVDWDILGGSWAERKPATGRYRNTRLNQYDSSSDLQWGIRKRTYLKANPAGVLTLALPDTPPDWDVATVEPFVRFELGSGLARVAIQLGKDGKCFLLRWDRDLWDWVYARDLPSPAKGSGYSDSDEVFIGYRVKRGQFLVSTDFGREWVPWGTPESVFIPGAKPILRGAGGEIDFGLHKLWEYTGKWRRDGVPTLTSTFFGSALIDGRYDAPPGSSVTFTDVSDTLAALAGYEATLTPNADGEGPVLYWTVLGYLTQATAGSASYTTPWTGTAPTNGRCAECRVHKPQSLKEATCSLRIKLAPGTTPLTALRRRKLQVRLGYRTWDAFGASTDHWWTVFTGYVGTNEISQDSFGNGWQTLEASASSKWTRPTWWPTDVKPLGGMLLNDALDFIVKSEGVSDADLPNYRSWHALGNSFRLDPGSPEEPFELLRPGEEKWATAERLAGYPEMELGVDDVGKLFTLRKNPLGVPAVTGVIHDYHTSGSASTDLEKLAESVRNRTDYDRSGTAVMTSARSQVDGSAVRAYAVDRTAETDTTSERFCPWREGEQEEVNDPCGPGMLVYKTGERAYDLFPLKMEPDVNGFLNLGVGRRDEIRFHGAADQALPDNTKAVVMTAEHTVLVDLESGASTLETVLGLYKEP
jgi:hypothetical protein